MPRESYTPPRPHEIKSSKPPKKKKPKKQIKKKSHKRHREGSTTSSSSAESQKRSRKRFKSKTKRQITSSSSESPSPKRNQQRTEHMSYSGAQAIIPEFDPHAKTQTVKDWVNKINESADIYGWTEKQTAYFALPRLAGLGKVWYENQTTRRYTWAEWQIKLLEAFTRDENYGDLLSEMLARKSRKNETLEEYYYDKLRLVRMCEIEGNKAVDCITHGIYDNNTRQNAQGLGFKEPEDLLAYLRKLSISRKRDDQVRPGISRENQELSASNQKNRGPTNKQYKCFNCGETGHSWMKCPKEIVQCVKCRRVGHSAAQCNKTDTSDRGKARGTKNILKIHTKPQANDKYYKDVTVNSIDAKAFIDFGSDCTLVSDQFSGVPVAKDITDKNDDLPILKGFGNAVFKPMRRVQIHIKVEGVSETIDAFVVPHSLLPCVDILIGQNLTELPHVRVLKTDQSLLLFCESSDAPVRITLREDTRIQGVVSAKVTTGEATSDHIYISSDACMKPKAEYLILPGIYKFTEGSAEVILLGLAQTEHILPRGLLIARGKILPGIMFNDSMPLGVPHVSAAPEVLNVCRISELSSEEKPQISPDDINVDKDLGEEAKQYLCELITANRKCFALTTAELGKTDYAEMCIRLKDDSPVTYRPYRLSFSERVKVKDIVEDLLKHEIVRESESEYASPIIVVPKKNGEVRLCVDYRALNKKTFKDKYPMPLIEDQIDSLSGQNYFTTLDLTSGYYQIPIAEESKHITAFVTPDGHYEYNRMPFGLCNAPAVFQRMIHKVLNPKKIPGVLTYMDDIIISSTTVEEGIDRLKLVMDTLKEAKLTLNLSKCHFFKKRIEFLGYEISSQGVQPGVKKVEAVAAFQKPKNAHQIRQFIGLASFFRRFVPNFATIAKPLTSLTKSNAQFIWGDNQEAAFTKIKEILTSRPVLAIFNPSYLTELHTDASQHGIGGILLQRPDDKSPLRPVAYFSRQTTADEEHFHSFELETLAVIMSLNRFRQYLLGLDFKIFTDCSAVRQTWEKRDLVPRIARWWLQAQEFTFTIEYRPGIKMLHADALSRNPVANRSDDVVDSMVILDVQKISVSNLNDLQMTDPTLCHIKSVLDNNCVEAKDIKNNYILKEGKIYRKIGDELKWVVPQDARWKVCHMTHDECGHFSLEKTLGKLKQTYWFPRMTQFVKRYVQACIPCAYSKQAGGRKEGFLHAIPKTPIPFHCIHIDHLGPFIKSKLGNTYILGIIDGYTKFIILRAVRNTKSKTTIVALRDVFGLFGVPKLLISDRGTSFTSSEFQEFAREQEIKHVQNAVAMPRANGQIERYNRSILASLIALTHGDDDKNWDTHLNTVQWSLNNTLNKGIGKTPAEVVFCKQTVSPNESHLHDLITNTNTPNIQMAAKIREEVTENINGRQQEMTERFNRTRCAARIYKENDLVLVQKQLNNQGNSNKLLPRYSGPYKVSKVLGNDRYEVTSIDGHSKRKYTNVYAAEKIKPWIKFVDPEAENEENNGSTSGSSST